MKILRYINKSTKTLLVLSSIAMISFNSFASYTQVSALITENKECGNNGYFDDPNPDYNGFSSCRISVENGTDTAYLSDVIAKFNTEPNDDGEYFQVSTQYEDDVVEGDWNPSNFGTTDSTGTWIYNNNVHTYPDIRFWVAKSSNAFRLHWLIQEEDGIDDACIGGNESGNMINLNYACMSLAISVTNGQWVSPNNSLSHITFFGGLCTGPECDDPVTPVPEPLTLVIFSLGLLGLGLRRKQSIDAKK